MKTHELKCWPAPFAAMLKGVKVHEVRRDDGRGFAGGDALLLREYDASTREYTGRQTARFVTYVSRGPDWGLPEEIVVMSLRAI